MPDLPEVVRPFGWLLGTWEGEGVGAVPGGQAPDFPYAETITFSCDDAMPWLTYTSRAVATDDGRWLHGEHGWWRPSPARADGVVEVEVVIALPTGVAEVFLGELSEGGAGPQVDLATDVVARTPTGLPVTADKRLYAVRAGKLMYAIDLAVGDAPIAPHLAAALDRADDPLNAASPPEA